MLKIEEGFILVVGGVGFCLYIIALIAAVILAMIVVSPLLLLLGIIKLFERKKTSTSSTP